MTGIDLFSIVICLVNKTYCFSTTRKHKRRNHGAPPFPRKSGPCPDSDYMATFKGITQRPRSSKRPMTEVPFARIPREPMMLDTNQRSDFRSHGHIERTKPIIPVGWHIFYFSSWIMFWHFTVSESRRLWVVSCSYTNKKTTFRYDIIDVSLSRRYTFLRRNVVVDLA